jgi:hypothetical protein
VRVFDVTAAVWWPDQQDMAVVQIGPKPCRIHDTTNWRAEALVETLVPSSAQVVLLPQDGRLVLQNLRACAVVTGFTQHRVPALSRCRVPVDVLPLPGSQPALGVAIACRGRHPALAWCVHQGLFQDPASVEAQTQLVDFVRAAMDLLLPWSRVVDVTIVGEPTTSVRILVEVG